MLILRPDPEEGNNDPRKRLWDELVHLRHAWQEYVYLFRGPSERVDLLSESASWFFGHVQRMLIQDVYLRISRLTDGLRSRGKRNLTLATLLDDPALPAESPLRTELTERIAAIRTNARSIRDHRNWFLAHLDHELAIAPTAAEIPWIKQSEIEGILLSMESTYRHWSLELHHSDASFDLMVIGNAQALERTLQEGRLWRSTEKKAWRKAHGLSEQD